MFYSSLFFQFANTSIPQAHYSGILRFSLTWLFDVTFVLPSEFHILFIMSELLSLMSENPIS
jgi:hypothetical protein